MQAGARYTEVLMKALGVEQAILVGHSAGALTAMELFKRCLCCVLRLCLWRLSVVLNSVVNHKQQLIISSSKVNTAASLPGGGCRPALDLWKNI